MLVELLVVVIVLAIVLFLIERYLVPLIPAPWGKFVLIIIIAIAVVYLITRFL